MKKLLIVLFALAMIFSFVSCKDEPHVHTVGGIVKENEVVATCQNEGSYDLVVRCTECNEVLSSTHETVEKANHDIDFRGICSSGNESYSTEAGVGSLKGDKQFEKVFYYHFNLKGGNYQMIRNGGNPVKLAKLYKADGTEISFAIGTEIELPAGDYYFTLFTDYLGENGGVSLTLNNTTHAHVYDYKGNCTLPNCDGTIYKGVCDKIYGAGGGSTASYVDSGVYKYNLTPGRYQTAHGGSGTGFVGVVYNEAGEKIADTHEIFTVSEDMVVYITFEAGSSACRYLTMLK